MLSHENVSRGYGSLHTRRQVMVDGRVETLDFYKDGDEIVVRDGRDVYKFTMVGVSYGEAITRFCERVEEEGFRETEHY